MGMLDSNPDKRVGGGPKGQEEVMKKAFFQSVDFPAFYQKRVPPPLKPEVNENPLKYVDKEFLGMATVDLVMFTCCGQAFTRRGWKRRLCSSRAQLAVSKRLVIHHGRMDQHEDCHRVGILTLRVCESYIVKAQIFNCCSEGRQATVIIALRR